MKKYLWIGIAVVVLGYVLNYGFTFSFPPCANTEEEKVIPSELQGATLVVEKHTPVLIGDDGEGLSCTKTLSTIERRIGVSKYVPYNVADESGSADGLHLAVKRIIRSETHGVGSIEGSFPIDWLILEDENGVQYRVATVLLGYNSQESFIGVWKDGQRKGSLVWQGYTGGMSIDTTPVGGEKTKI